MKQLNIHTQPAKILLLYFILLFTGINLRAQAYKVIPPNIKIINDSIDSKVKIDFKTDWEIDNVLVFITDPKGNTVFLENKYRFTGKYTKNVDLTPAGKGDFLLTIICDDEEVKRKLIIR
ncbi:MAG: hypothetical protein HYX39_07735 [Bacteroidetes bacterium]|nr:hypothetical protein [Bacteroidota bacterium]